MSVKEVRTERHLTVKMSLNFFSNHDCRRDRNCRRRTTFGHVSPLRVTWSGRVYRPRDQYCSWIHCLQLRGSSPCTVCDIIRILWRFHRACESHLTFSLFYLSRKYCRFIATLNLIKYKLQQLPKANKQTPQSL